MWPRPFRETHVSDFSVEVVNFSYLSETTTFGIQFLWLLKDGVWVPCKTKALHLLLIQLSFQVGEFLLSNFGQIFFEEILSRENLYIGPSLAEVMFQFFIIRALLQLLRHLRWNEVTWGPSLTKQNYTCENFWQKSRRNYCRPSVCGIIDLFLEQLVNKNNGNPTCSLLGSEPIGYVVVIRPIWLVIIWREVKP